MIKSLLTKLYGIITMIHQARHASALARAGKYNEAKRLYK